MSLFRPTALKYVRNIGCAVVLVLALLSFWSAAALAAPAGKAPAPAPHVKAAPAKVSEELAVCPGQTFAQPFAALGDSNYYTLVEGSQFNGGSEGWELWNGAEVVEGIRPDGSFGGVLDLPSGAMAVSPPVCVTLQYPTARAWVQSVQGGGGVTVGVYYAGTKATGQPVGQLSGTAQGGWGLSSPFSVKPELTGKQEGVREVRFVYANTTKDSDFRLSGLFVDPRML
jgi:hypothetical protein